MSQISSCPLDYYCLLKAVFARLCKMLICLVIFVQCFESEMLYLWYRKNKFLSREKCEKSLKHIMVSLFLTFRFLLWLLLKQFSKYFAEFQRQFQSPSCKSSKHSFKSNTFCACQTERHRKCAIFPSHGWYWKGWGIHPTVKILADFNWVIFLFFPIPFIYLFI